MLDKRGGEHFVANCSTCGVDLETYTPDFNAAREILKSAGWKTERSPDGMEWNHYCPEHK